MSVIVDLSRSAPVMRRKSSRKRREDWQAQWRKQRQDDGAPDKDCQDDQPERKARALYSARKIILVLFGVIRRSVVSHGVSRTRCVHWCVVARFTSTDCVRDRQHILMPACSSQIDYFLGRLPMMQAESIASRALDVIDLPLDLC